MVTSVTTGCLIKDVPKGIEKGVKSGLEFELLSYLGIKSEKFQQNLQKKCIYWSSRSLTNSMRNTQKTMIPDLTIGPLSAETSWNLLYETVSEVKILKILS